MSGELVPAAEQSASLPKLMISPTVSPAEVLDEHELVRKMVGEVLQEGRDYGQIRGTQKKTLWKPGADRLGDAFGVRPRFAIVEREVDHDREVDWSRRKWNKKRRTYETESGTSVGLYRYVIRCELIHRASGVVVGEAIGSASTMESRYVDRPRELENTVLKMAEKRAHVGAIVSTFGLSEMFETIEDVAGDQEPPPGRGRSGQSSEDDTPPSRPATERQISILAERIADDRITDDEREKLLARLEKGLTFVQANDLLDRIDRQLEERAAPDDESGSQDDLPF